MRRATSNSRAVSGRHGSSAATRPRAIRASASARSANGRNVRRDARVSRASTASASASANLFERTRQYARSSRAHEASQIRPLRVPAGGSPPRGRSRATPVEPSASDDEPRPCARARRATPASSPSVGRGMPEKRRRIGRADRPRCAARTPVTTNGMSRRARRPARAVASASWHMATARSASPAKSADLREPPQRRQDELDRLAVLAELQGRRRAPRPPRAARRARGARSRAPQRAMLAPRRQPRSATAWRARLCRSAQRPPAQATIALVAAMTWAQWDCSIGSA